MDLFYPNGEEADEAKYDNFINSINHVVRSHQGLIIDEFRICYNFSDRHCTTIHSCLDFALKKGVKRLEFQNCGIY